MAEEGNTGSLICAAFARAFRAAWPTGHRIRIVFSQHPKLLVPPGVLNEFGERAMDFCRPAPHGRRDTHVLQDGLTESFNVNGRWVRFFIPWEAIHWISDEDTGACYYQTEIIQKAREFVAQSKPMLPPPDARLAGAPKAAARGWRVIDGGGETTAPKTGHLALAKKEG